MDNSDKIRYKKLARRIDFAVSVLKGENIGVFTFCPGDAGCHSYHILAKNIEEAIDKFDYWQQKNLDLEYRWPSKKVKDTDNWYENDASIHIVY